MENEFSNYEAGQWKDTELEDNSLETRLNEVAMILEENIESTKAEIEKMGGEEALDKALQNNAELTIKMFDKGERIMSAIEGLAVAGVGGAVAYGAAFTNILGKMNAMERSVTDPYYQTAVITGAGIMALLMGCYEILSAIKGKEWKPFTSEKTA